MKLIEEVMAEDITVLEAHGRLDSTTAQQLRDRLIALVQAGRSAIVVDLKDVAYISSAGFQALLIANRAAAESQGSLALCGVIDDVKRLFEIACLTEHFLICQTQTDAAGFLGVRVSKPVSRVSKPVCFRDVLGGNSMLRLTTICAAILVAAIDVAAAQTPIERGKYLVDAVMACDGCHTPRAPAGLVMEKRFSGGSQTWDEHAYTVKGSNITSDRDTGIGLWSAADLKRLLNEGVRPNGVSVAPHQRSARGGACAGASVIAPPFRM